MHTERIRARAASAKVIGSGFVCGYRLEFHKRSLDGSAKANARRSASKDDRVWGVVFSMSREHKSALDEHEPGYEEKQITVATANQELTANLYVAQDDFIDTTLKPYWWYHALVLQGARQHRLPDAYINELREIETITDPDEIRRNAYCKLLG